MKGRANRLQMTDEVFEKHAGLRTTMTSSLLRKSSSIQQHSRNQDNSK